MKSEVLVVGGSFHALPGTVHHESRKKARVGALVWNKDVAAPSQQVDDNEKVNVGANATN